MTNVKITDDILLSELFELFPEGRDFLMEYGYGRIAELGIESVVTDKLSVKGLVRLFCAREEESGALIKKIQNLYNKKLEEL